MNHPMYKTIASPVNYGGLQLKNRIIFAPTTLGLKNEAYLEKIRQIAAGGCAMVILGDVPVRRFGFGQSLYTRKALPPTANSRTRFMGKTAWPAPSFTRATPT